MNQGSTAAMMLQESKAVLQTNGEWELADIAVGQTTLTIDVGSYSEIKYYVSTFNHPL